MTAKNQAASGLGPVGVAAIILAVYMQAQVNAKATVDRLLGLQPSGSPWPWIVGVAGAVCVLAAIVLVVRPEPTEDALPPGWYDDPESPRILRYRDESGWTYWTAPKDSGE